MLRIALCDTLHLHKRNFTSFFEMMEEEQITPSVLLDPDVDGYDIITCSGNYTNLEQQISPFVAHSINAHAAFLAEQTIDTLYDSEMLGLRLWPMCRSELMSYLLSQDHWQTEVMLKDDRAIFEKAFKENHADLTLNIAVTKHWLNHWYHNRKKIFSHHACCVFSGSSIHTRTLLELLRRSPCRAFVLESTFTGNDYLFEEMYQPIANNLGVRHKNTRVSRRDESLKSPTLYENEIIKARNKIVQTNNKNVKQPETDSLPHFPHDQDQILILGQVVNDYSLIEDGFPYVGSIPVYKELIQKLLDNTSCNIVFKTHPWEHKKKNIEAPYTFEALADLIRGFPDHLRSRILLVDDVNLQDLLDNSKYFITFCSQSSIEAALNGLRPIVLGRTFYSHAGFTSDCSKIDDVITAVKTIDGTLTLDEYNNFNQFIVDLFQFGTVSVFKSGKNILKSTLQISRSLEQKTPIRAELDLRKTHSSSRLKPSQWTGIRQKQKSTEDAEIIKNLGGKVSIFLQHFPNTFHSHDDSVKLSFHVENHSEYIIPRQLKGKKCFASYHIYDEHGKRYIWNGERVLVAGNIQQGHQQNIPFKIPDVAGKYTVVPALLFDSMFWLDSDKSWEFEVV